MLRGWNAHLVSDGFELHEIDGRKILVGGRAVELVEGVVGTLHTRIEKVAGVGSRAVICKVRRSAIQGEISRCNGIFLRGLGRAVEIQMARTREPEQIEN